MGETSWLARGEDSEAQGPGWTRLEGIGCGRVEIGEVGCRVWASMDLELITVGKEGAAGRGGWQAVDLVCAASE